MLMKIECNKTRNIVRDLSEKSKAKYSILRLHKSLYGLKQAAKEWYRKLKTVLSGIGLAQSTADPCLFTSCSEKGEREYALVYVDDIIICARTSTLCKKVIDMLHSHFILIKTDDADFFLGVNIARDRERKIIRMSQVAYIEKVLRRFGMLDTVARVPMVNGSKIEKSSIEDVEEAKHVPFREIMGCLMYLATTTRPDIMFSVSRLARKFSGWSLSDRKLAKNVLRYVSGTKSLSLCFGTESDNIIGYSDADHAGDKINRKSTGGFVFIRAGGAFSWSSKMQYVVAHSSVESEYIALSRCVREALWIRKLLFDFGMKPLPIDVRADSQGAISLSKDFKANADTKHISTAYHLTRDYSSAGLVKITYLPTAAMVADGLTKPLDRIKLERNRAMMGLAKLIEPSIQSEKAC